MSLLRQLAGETVIYGMSNILPRILHFVVFTSYFTYKFKDQENYGLYTDLYAYTSIILVILICRMDTALFRFASRSDDKNKVFGTAVLPLFITTLLFVVIAIINKDWIAAALTYEGRGYYIIWFAFILAFDTLVALPFARFRLENKPLKFLLYKLLNTLITVFLVIVFLEILPRMIEQGCQSCKDFLFLEQGIDYAFFANLIASALLFLLLIPEYLKQKLEFDKALWIKMIKYSIPLVVVAIAGSFNQSFAVPLQKYFLGGDTISNLRSAGVYAATAKLALLLNLFILAFNYAAEPFFFNQFAKKENKEIYGIVALAFTVAGCIVLLVIALYVDVFQFIIGTNYREALSLLPILLFAYLFLGLYYNFSIWYKLVDKTIVGAWISIGGALITLLVSLFLFKSLGVEASAWAALCCYAFMAIAGLLIGKYHYPIDYPIGKIVFYTSMTLLILLISNYLSSNINGQMLKLALNTVLLLIFVVIVITREKELIRELGLLK